MCDCNVRINKQLEDMGKEDRLLWSTSMDWKTGRTRNTLPIWTTKYTKNGNPKNGLPIIAAFCPFCGVQYETPTVTEEQPDRQPQ